MAGQRPSPGSPMSFLSGSKIFLLYLLTWCLSVLHDFLAPLCRLSYRGREPWRDMTGVSTLPGKPGEEVGQASSDSGKEVLGIIWSEILQQIA